jgi:dTDP-4-dehydrorhamnose 3,5-epimerase
MKLIKDVELIPLKVNVDDRGYLIVFGSSGRPDAPHIPQIKEVYLVGDFGRGVIRGLHKHSKLWDHFFVSRGAAKFVLVDDREDSPTYREINTFILSERNPTSLFVPPGVYHGWMSLEEDTQMISIANEMHNKEKPDEVRIPPDTFGDVWSVKGR